MKSSTRMSALLFVVLALAPALMGPDDPPCMVGDCLVPVTCSGGDAAGPLLWLGAVALVMVGSAWRARRARSNT